MFMQKKPDFDRIPSGSEIKNEKKSSEQTASLRRAGAMLLILVASMSARSESIEPSKAEGPYVERAVNFPEISPYEEADLGVLANPLELSDSFDGVISTVGYAVLFDRQKISKNLAIGEVAVLEQVEQTKVRGAVHRLITREVIGDQQKAGVDPMIALDDFMAAESTANGLISWNDNKLLTETTGLEVLGGGVDVTNNDAAAELVLSVYRHTTNDSYELVSKRTAKVDIRELPDCNDDLTVTSEVVLTHEQIAALCKVVDEYDSLLPKGTGIAADYITHPDDAQDAAYEHALQLSYPEPHGVQWPGEKIDATVLHEALHMGYSKLSENAPARIRAGKIYKMILRNMTYQLPDSKRAPFEKSVGSIEPIWGVITESSYEDEHPAAGHPWGAPTEMVSSAMSVVTYHTDEFLDKFEGLPEKQRRIIRNAIDASYDVFIAAGGDSENVMSAYAKVSSGMLDLMEK